MGYFAIINSMNKLDTNAAAFLNITGITDRTTVQSINNLVKSLKTAGLWTRCIAIYPFVGGTAVTNKYNLVNTSQYTITFVGTWTYASTGVLPIGLNSYANTGMLATILSQNNAHLAFYSRTNAAASDRVSMGAIVGGSSPMVGIQLRNAAGNAVAQNASGTVNQTAVFANANSQGFYMSSKNSSSIGGLVMYKNGVSQASNPVAITVNNYPSANILIGAYSTTTFFDDKECAYASIGLSMNATQAANYNTIITNFETEQGRNV